MIVIRNYFDDVNCKYDGNAVALCKNFRRNCENINISIKINET